jgi:ankyrin repeat protein
MQKDFSLLAHDQLDLNPSFARENVVQGRLSEYRQLIIEPGLKLRASQISNKFGIEQISSIATGCTSAYLNRNRSTE